MKKFMRLIVVLVRWMRMRHMNAERITITIELENKRDVFIISDYVKAAMPMWFMSNKQHMDDFGAPDLTVGFQFMGVYFTFKGRK